MKAILVPLSSSEKEKNTLQYAIDFAERVSAKVYVIKVYSPNKVSGSIKTVGSLLEENANKELKELVLSVDRKNVEVIASSLPGALIDNIQLFRQKIDIDLIISPSNRISSDETIYIGKITGSIINNIDCPILVVPEGYVFKNISTIFMAIKSGTIKKENIFIPLRSLVENFNAKLNLLQVITPKLSIDEREVNKELSELASTIKSSENATVFQGVLEHLHEVSPDLLCVIRRNKGFFSKLWDQNTVKKSDFESRLPLLVLRGIL